MNLHKVVSSAIGAINPNQFVSVRPSIGNVEATDGTLAPAYGPEIKLLAQVQPLTGGDLRHVDALNIQGIHRVLYFSANVHAAVRVSLKGGDLVVLPDKSVWLVNQELEPFFSTAGWTKVFITLQNGS